ncbi:DUF1844 domain-containing protein, partial [Nevskia soli]|uniref:DUF1844 domain-containing protein n=1 Tax=Nevskia soli TaxID=418856 RepID=UPI001C5C9193
RPRTYQEFQGNKCAVAILIPMSENDTVEPSPERPPLPPASFEFLIFSMITQAQMQLGLLHFGPESEKPEPDFETARHTIDLLGIIQEKTKGNLTLEEDRLLNNSLTELRFRFVQAQPRKS